MRCLTRSLWRRVCSCLLTVGFSCKNNVYFIQEGNKLGLVWAAEPTAQQTSVVKMSTINCMISSELHRYSYKGPGYNLFHEKLILQV